MEVESNFLLEKLQQYFDHTTQVIARWWILSGQKIKECLTQLEQDKIDGNKVLDDNLKMKLI